MNNLLALILLLTLASCTNPACAVSPNKRKILLKTIEQLLIFKHQSQFWES